MKLKDRDLSFELNILGYQFSKSEDYDDSNWLKVKINALDENYSWSATDNCLLTYELADIRDWFFSIEKGLCDQKKLSFLEGELGFEYSKSKKTITVNLDFILHPKGDNYIYGENGDSVYSLSFTINDKNILTAINQLDNLIERYPERMKELKGT